MPKVCHVQDASPRVPGRNATVGALRGPRTSTPRLVSVAALWLAMVISGANHARGGTLVSLDFVGFGTVLVDLFDDLTPVTVANYLQYVNGNVYESTMIHRVDTGLGVIQGGGFNIDTSPVSPKFGQIVNEYSRANTRGTVSMARTASPDSAESQWFFNTADNTETLGQANGGGFAVFGWVVGDGMDVIDAIAAVPTFAYAPPFGQIPLQGFTQQDFDDGNDPLPHVVELGGVSVVETHPAFQNPVSVVDVDNSNSLEPLDALLVINQLIANGNQIAAVDSPFAGGSYLDVTGNGLIEPLDALLVINALLAQGGGGNLVAPQAASASVALVPEPSTIALAGAGAMALVGWMFARRRRRRG